jgi:cation diffusion facilitator CzcD-associated flavoprotein CzcO
MSKIAPVTAAVRKPTVAIIGAGMSGICMGVKLQRAGIDDFTIFEKGEDLGGTWRDNSYPGLYCDVPSRFYQFAFAMNPDWSHRFSPGAEIWRYFDRVATENGLRRKIRFRTQVVSARHVGGRWRLRTDSGEEHQADFLISATGVLHHPRHPEIEGLERFAGASFHSARWDHSVPLAGKKVGVIGTGSTGVQIVTALAGVASELTLFQRTAQWILPYPNRRFSRLTRALHRRFPALDRLSFRNTQRYFEWFSRALTNPGFQRRYVTFLCRAHLLLLRDRELRRRLTPSYKPMCKRLILSAGFYRAVQKPGVSVVDERIDRIEPEGVRTADGRLHELDVLVFATGFDTHAYVRPMELVGPEGRTLDEAWADGPRSWRTVAMPGFPNFFMLIGPQSPVGNYPLTFIAETQADFAIGWMRRWMAGELEQVAPKAEAAEEFERDRREAFPGTVWVTGCDSWYLGADGVPEIWPWTPDTHRVMLGDQREEEFELV